MILPCTLLSPLSVVELMGTFSESSVMIVSATTCVGNKTIVINVNNYIKLHSQTHRDTNPQVWDWLLLTYNPRGGYR